MQQDDDEDNDEAAAEEEGRVQPQDDDEEEDDEGEGLLASLFPVLSDEAGSPRSPIAKTGFGDKQASFSPAAAKASPAAGSRGLLTLSASPFAALSTVGRGGSASPATKAPARQGKHAEPQAAEASEARAPAAAVVPPEGKEQQPPAVVVEEEEEEEEYAGEEGMCVVEDVELPDMYLPGKVVHIYRYAATPCPSAISSAVLVSADCRRCSVCAVIVACSVRACPRGTSWASVAS